MQSKIVPLKTLIHFDIPELYHAQDQLGMNYLCLAVQENEEYLRYLCVPLSAGRLGDFINEKIDLRSIFEKSETGEYFYADLQDETGLELAIHEISNENIAQEWLPDAGIYFHKSIEQNVISKEADEKNRAIVHLSVNPPEAREETKISAFHLRDVLDIFQSMLKHALRKSISKLGKSVRDAINIAEHYEMEVFAFSPGSFTIHLQSKGSADMFGYIEMEKALSRIDEIVRNIDNPQKSFEILQENRGHLADTYIKLLKYIIDFDIPIYYQWKIPSANIKSGSIQKRLAEPLYELISQREELSKEIVELQGIVIMANDKIGSWILESDLDGKEYHGTGKSLEGITIRTIKYKFNCEEILEEAKFTGREERKYILLNFSELHDK